MTIRKFCLVQKYANSLVDYYTLDEGGVVHGYKSGNVLLIYTTLVNWEIFLKYWIESGYCVEIPY